MRLRLTPARRRGTEILDDPATSDEVRARSMRDVTRSNALFGGTRVATRAFAAFVSTLPKSAVLLDVGTGLGDVPATLVRDASRAGVSLKALGLERSIDLARRARERLAGCCVADACRIPLRDDAVDVVCCSQLLHHFRDDDARTLIAELQRVSRGWVIVAELRRSWLAAGGFWAASTGLRFHPVTRHDGVTSVLRGFTPRELTALVQSATGVTPTVRMGVFWRISAVWRKR